MPRITELYAYVTTDTNEDDEGVPAFPGPDGSWFPMMGADMERADSLREKAQLSANLSGKPVKLLRSTGLEVVDTLYPNKRAIDAHAIVVAGADDVHNPRD